MNDTRHAEAFKALWEAEEKAVRMAQADFDYIQQRSGPLWAVRTRLNHAKARAEQARRRFEGMQNENGYYTCDNPDCERCGREIKGEKK